MIPVLQVHLAVPRVQVQIPLVRAEVLVAVPAEVAEEGIKNQSFHHFLFYNDEKQLNFLNKHI